MTDPFVRLSLLMVRRKWAVLAVWVVVLVIAGGILGPRAADIVKGGGFEVPGSQSDKAAKVLQNEFHLSTGTTALVVFRAAHLTADDPSFRRQVTAALDRIQGLHTDVLSVVNPFSSGDKSLISSDRHTVLALVALNGDINSAPKLVPKLRDQLKPLPSSIQHFVTGRPALNQDTFSTSESDLKRAEAFTVPIVLILLLLVFRTVVAAGLPLILGACAVTVSEAMVFFLASAVDTSVFALNIASMIGLGLGIDFSLMVVTRLREELALGQSQRDAIAMTMATAGRSITYSAITVVLAMGILTVLVFNLMIVRSMSLAVIFVALTALAAGLTLLPALLAIFGHRIDWLRVVPQRRASAAGGDTGFWYRLSHAIMRRPWLWLGVSLAILGIIALPVKDLGLIGASPTVLPPSTESARGFKVVQDAFGQGRLTPIQIVVETAPNGVWTPGFLAALRQLSDTVASDPRNQAVQSLVTLARQAGVPASHFTALQPADFTTSPALEQAASQVVNLNGPNDKSVITIFSRYGQYDPRHIQTVHDLRDRIIPAIPALIPYQVFVGGESAGQEDFQSALYGRFPLIILAILVVIFIILMMFFQSVLLPIKAMLMNLVTVVATYGALVVVFQYSWFPTRIFGFTSEGLIGALTPVVLFAILFGLSTDYEVFMLSRVRELYHELRNNEEALAVGVQRTAGVITAAGLILIGTFGSFASAAVVSIKEIGIGLAVGVLLDTTVVRVILVPATMRLMGSANWWMPVWLHKIVPEIREAPSAQPVPAVAAAAPAGQPSLPVAAGAAAQVVAPRRIASAVAPRAALRGKLRPVGGGVGADDIPLSRRQPLRIGRDSSNELQLFDPQTSRFHASIDYQNGGYVITDQRSTNGVLINEVRIPPNTPTELRPGDVIQIGVNPRHRFTFELSSTNETAVYSRPI